VVPITALIGGHRCAQVRLIECRLSGIGAKDQSSWCFPVQIEAAALLSSQERAYFSRRTRTPHITNCWPWELRPGAPKTCAEAFDAGPGARRLRMW